MSTLTAAARDARTIAADTKAAALVENLEWLLKFQQSEYACLIATGYARKPAALKRQLQRIGRRDLIPRIFEHDAAVHEAQGRTR